MYCYRVWHSHCWCHVLVPWWLQTSVLVMTSPRPSNSTALLWTPLNVCETLRRQAQVWRRFGTSCCPQHRDRRLELCFVLPDCRLHGVRTPDKGLKIAKHKEWLTVHNFFVMRSDPVLSPRSYFSLLALRSLVPASFISLFASDPIHDLTFRSAHHLRQ
jgi:hypothetical protein